MKKTNLQPDSNCLTDDYMYRLSLNFKKRFKLLAVVSAIFIMAPAASAYTYQLNDSFETHTSALSGPVGSPWGVENSTYDNANVTVQSAQSPQNSPTRAGSYAVHLVNNFSDPTVESRARTEMTTSAGKILWDHEYWVGFSFYLKNWTQSSYWEAIHQFHAIPGNENWTNTSGRNLTGISIKDGIMTLEVITIPKTGAAGGGASGATVWQAPAQSNTWYDCVMHVRPSQGSTGIIEVWMQGKLIYQQKGPNVDPYDTAGVASYPAHYLKCGIYNSPWRNGTYDVSQREIIYDEVKIGHVEGGYTGGYAGVAPGGSVAVPAASSAPTNLTATCPVPYTVNLAWFDTSSNETEFRVERKTGSGGSYSQIGTVPANVTTYNDTNCDPDTTYYYRVRAYNGSNNSPYSREANARFENFGDGASDFSVVKGTWVTDPTYYRITGAESGTVHSALSLLNTPVAGNFMLRADCTAISTGGSWDNFNIVFGYQDINNCYYINGSETANGTWNGLYKLVNGVSTRLYIWTEPEKTFTPGTAYHMKVQRVGSSILVYRDDTLVATVFDTAFMSGRVGFGSSMPTSGLKPAQFSNVSLTQSDLTGVQDDFSGGTGNFTVVEGSWAVNSNGQYEVTGNGTNSAASLAVLNTPFTGDFVVSGDCTSISSTSTWDNMNIVFNYQDINNYYYVNFAESNTGIGDRIFKKQNGVVTTLAYLNTTFTPNIIYNLKVQKTGNTITVWSNNVQVGTATDTTFTGGKIGFGTSNITAGVKLASFDNIVVTTP